MNGQLLGFSNVEADGSYTGIDVDYCKAIAAAVLGDPEAVEYTDLTAETRFTALQSGDIDVLIRNGTWTASRDGALGLQWTATTFYDGQGMLVAEDSGFNSVADMDGAIICVQTGTTTEINLETYFEGLGVTYEPLNVADEAAVLENFSSGACDGYTTDKSGLASFAATYEGGPVKILDDTMSKEPLGPAVREGDEEWFDIIQWVVFATFQAEEFGLTSENISSYDGDNPALEASSPRTSGRARVPRRRVGRPGDRSGGQLPGDLRPQHRAARHRRGVQPALDRGRADVLAAVHLIPSQPWWSRAFGPCSTWSSAPPRDRRHQGGEACRPKRPWRNGNPIGATAAAPRRQGAAVGVPDRRGGRGGLRALAPVRQRHAEPRGLRPAHRVRVPRPQGAVRRSRASRER